MNLTSPFLTKKGGYTSSKANFYANVIKQICNTTDSTLESHVLISKTIDQNGQQVDYIQNTPVLSVDDIVNLATKEGRYYAVSAWLREGIKAKEALVNQVRFASPALLGVEMPQLSTYNTDLIAAATIAVPNEDDLSSVLDKLSVADRADYLTLEAEASHIGQRIHNKQALFNRWRTLAVNFKPIEFYNVNPTVSYMLTNKLRLDVSAIDSILLRLQGLHRSLESKLNAYKARLKTLLHEEIQKAQAQRRDAEEAQKVAYEKYAHDVKIANATIEQERSKQLVEVSKLGIIIPKVHEVILQEVEEAVKYDETEVK